MLSLYSVGSMWYSDRQQGFITGATLNIYLSDRLGFGKVDYAAAIYKRALTAIRKVITLGTMAQALAYILMVPAPPFPVIVFSFSIYGFGSALVVGPLNCGRNECFDVF